jgi:hypothetical protein
LFEYVVSNDTVTLAYANFTSNAWSEVSTRYTNESIDGWNVVIFEPTADGLDSWINNNRLHIRGPFFEGKVHLNVGLPFAGGGNYSFNGYVTQLYSDASMPLTQIGRSFQLDALGNMTEVSLNSSNLELTLLTGPGYSKVQVGNYSYNLTTPMDSFSFGKLTAGDYGLTIRLNHMKLLEKTSGFYLMPVYFATLIPFLVALLVFWHLLRKPKQMI